MLGFVNRPNLPASQVALCAVGEGTAAKNALKALGIDVLSLKADSGLCAPVTTHADMLMLHTGGNSILLLPLQQDAALTLTGYGFNTHFTTDTAMPEYPHDVLLNALIINNRVFAHKRTLQLLERDAPELKGMSFVEVKQGYTRCSVCPVTSDAVITEDKGLAAVLRSFDTDVLLIEKGSVLLNGYDCGFIGGACALISDKTLAINGNLRYNSNKLWSCCSL